MLEIIIIDSGSNDGSVSIANSFGAEVVMIDPTSFNHGLTRNLGVEYAKGDLIYFTVQDAELASVDHLEKMISHFQDEDVQGVVGIQGYPHRSYANPALWFKQFDEPLTETRHFPNNAFEMLTANEQFELSNWDNVNAMYRKSALIKIPFVQTNFSEDWVWANQSLKAGMKLLRDPSILVWHYHHMTFDYTLRSKFIVNYYFNIFFNHVPQFPLSLMPLFRRTNTLLFKRKSIKIKDRVSWVFHNCQYFVANFISIILFRLFYFFAKHRGLDCLYRYLCRSIPQGKSN